MYTRRLLVATVLIIACVQHPGRAWAQVQTDVIRTALGRFCIDVPRSNFQDGTKVQLYPCQGSENQVFSHDWKTQEIKIKGLCLDAFLKPGGQAGQAGDVVGVYHCNNAPNQKWHAYNWCPPGKRCLEYVRPDYVFETMNKMCLNVPNSNTGQGVGLIIYPCEGSANETWYFGQQ